MGASTPRWVSPLRPATMLVVALLLAAAVAPWSLRLRPHSELVDLLPRRAPEAEAYREWIERFGGVQTVFVVVSVEPGEEEREGDLPLELAADVQAALATTPGVASVRMGLEDEDERFLLEQIAPRASLLLPAELFPEEVLTRLEPEALAARAELLARRLRLPGQEWQRELLRRDPLGLTELLPAFETAATSLPVDPVTGVFSSEDGRSVLLVVETEGGELDPAAGRALGVRLREIAESVTQSGGTLHAVGGPLYAAQDEELFRADLWKTVTTSLLACLVILLGTFGRWREPLVVLLPVVYGLWLTTAFLQWTGGVAALSLGFAAVLVGLGIDYGIHTATRFRAEWQRSGDGRSALERSLRSCAPAILVSAVTTALAFLVLTFADLSLLADLGRTVAAGIVAILLSTWLLGGALLRLLASSGRARGAVLWRPLQRLVEGCVGLGVGRRGLVLTVATLLTLAALPGLSRLSLNTDPRELRPDHHPATVAQQLVTDTFGIGFETATVLVDGDSVDAALERARRLTETLRRELPSGSAVTSPSDWLVGEETRDLRLALLADGGLAQALPRLEQELRRVGFSPAAFSPGLDALEDLASGVDPVTEPGRQPDWIRRQLSTDPSPTVAISVRQQASEAGVGPEAVASLVALAESSGARLASAATLDAAIGRVARADFERLALFALLAVALALLLSFRLRLGPTLAALTPMTLGIVWTLGLWGWVGGRIDLMSLAVVPIVIGIGIDDGLHALHGVSLHGDLPSSVRYAGRAMALTTVTTAAGFASLGLSDIPGLRHAGILVAVAVSLCLAATLVVLPALEGARRR